MKVKKSSKNVIHYLSHHMEIFPENDKFFNKWKILKK